MRRTSDSLYTRVAGGVAAAFACCIAAGAPSAAAQTPPAAPAALAPQSITTVAGNHTLGSGGDGGPAVKAQLDQPTGIAEDLAGSLYIADSRNNQVRKVVNPTSINQDVITTIAGDGRRGLSGNGGLATGAELNDPTGLAIDSAGDVFIADTGNNQVREVHSSGQITTFAGTGRCTKGEDDQGDGGSAMSQKSPTSPIPATSASLCRPTGLAVLGHTLYIADTGHNVVWVVDGSGMISDFLGGRPGGPSQGSRGSRADTGAGGATLASPTGLAVDALGDVYVSDTGHDRVLEVSSAHQVTTVASGRPHGDGSNAGNDPGGAPRLKEPTGLALDATDGLYIADTAGNRIWQLSGSGTLMRFAGTGQHGFSGDGGPALKAKLAHPTGVVADASAVYFADTGNNVVRGVFSGPPPVLPQSPLAIFLPLTAAVAVGGGVVWRVRRRRRYAR